MANENHQINLPDVEISPIEPVFEPPSTSGKPPEYEICSIHRGIKNLFCTDCVAVICGGCILEEHDGHSTERHEAALNRGIRQHADLQWDIEDTINEIVVTIRKLKSMSKEIDHNYDTAQCDTGRFIKECHEALTERKKDLLRSLHQARKQKIFRLFQQSDGIEDSLEALIRIHEKINNSFSVTDPVSQVQMLTEAQQSLIDAYQNELHPSANDNISFKTDEMELVIRHFLGQLQIGGDIPLIPEEDEGIAVEEQTDDI